MKEFLSQVYYQNTVLEWLTALGIVLVSLVMGRVVYWFFDRVVKRLTARTNTKLDDILIDMIEEPIMLIVIILGVKIAFNYLHLSHKIFLFLRGLFYLCMALSVAWLIVRLLSVLVDEVILHKSRRESIPLSKKAIPVIKSVFIFTIWVLAIIIGLSNAGYDVFPLLTGLSIGGLALAFAVRNTLANILGGITLIFNRSFDTQDHIKIGAYEGEVEDISFSTTRLRLAGGEKAIFPNKFFTDKEVLNLSAANLSSSSFDLNVSIDTAPERLEEILEQLSHLPALVESAEPKGQAYIFTFSESAVLVKFTYFTARNNDFWKVHTQMGITLLKFLKENDIKLAGRATKPKMTTK
ncbi:MAG: hypothetical protein EAZ57_07025 [Cytophagales bacterium]|nr:MAG: hypothetical protein EAZ67_13980 [Cytophagales bacterium]TAF60606.1 MAG: hypothetical protein EAZ57_07025 [Cytophagales bacterium]